MERFQFDPEGVALRTMLVGTLKIDPESPESKRLLQAWAAKGEKLVRSGALDLFAWNKEEAETYVDAGWIEGAIWVLKCALYEAEHQQREDVISDLRTRLEGLGSNPDDLSEVSGG